MSEQPGGVVAERERLLAEYQRRGREVPKDRYAPWQRSVQFLRAGRTRTALSMVAQAGAFPQSGDPCLEVGYGSLGWLGELVCWGVREQDLHGIEIDPSRAERARRILPGADLRVGDATRLPWESDRFKLVVTSTVFSSILDTDVRRLVACEIVRVLRPGGAMLWYDFAFDNPGNRNVHGVRRRELRALFPELSGRIRRVTLAPPLARVVAPMSWPIATLLEQVRWLRTHLMAVLIKNAPSL